MRPAFKYDLHVAAPYLQLIYCVLSHTMVGMDHMRSSPLWKCWHGRGHTLRDAQPVQPSTVGANPTNAASHRNGMAIGQSVAQGSCCDLGESCSVPILAALISASGRTISHHLPMHVLRPAAGIS